MLTNCSYYLKKELTYRIDTLYNGKNENKHNTIFKTKSNDQRVIRVFTLLNDMHICRLFYQT